MRLSGIKLVASFFLAAVLSAPAWGATPALPGTLNYVEGQASIGDEVLNSKSVGSVDLAAGQTLATGTGKAEVLMTPGVFFRLGDNSAATLVSPSLTNTEIALNKGQAMVEVTDISKNNDIRVDENGAAVKLVQKGLYEFDAGLGGNVEQAGGDGAGAALAGLAGGDEVDCATGDGADGLLTTALVPLILPSTEVVPVISRVPVRLAPPRIKVWEPASSVPLLPGVPTILRNVLPLVSATGSTPASFHST